MVHKRELHELTMYHDQNFGRSKASGLHLYLNVSIFVYQTFWLIYMYMNIVTAVSNIISF